MKNKFNHQDFPARCLQVRGAGECTERFRNFYFDGKECKESTKGKGCGANDNSFESMGECIKLCKVY
jgi:Kunitz/Bovine pancreatic trypsin inhibitor domain